MTKTRKTPFEFIALMASLMSITALSTDAILPGLNPIGESLKHADKTDLQLIITMMFLGLGFGQLIFGTLSDTFGRKPIVYSGIIVFLLASFICIHATSLEMMLLGRFLQGIGLSATRSISTSIIRDLYTGDYMARIMSFITVTFIIVPMIAPLIGQIILSNFDWKAIFYFQMLFTLAIGVWFMFRQKETLKLENKIKLSRTIFIDGVKEFIQYRDSIIYTLISGFMTGSFMIYLSTSKDIFQDQYGFTEEFVFIFAGLAFFIGFSVFLNGSFVMKFGMQKLSSYALIIFTVNALIYSMVFYQKLNPPIYILIGFLVIQFMSYGFIMGNVRALTMQPIGHIAGIGASLSGFASTLMAVPFAYIVGKQLTTTALPIFIGFSICGIACLLLLLYKNNTTTETGT